MRIKQLLLTALCAVMSVGAWAQITSLPYSTDFSSVNPFEGGSVVDGTSVKSVLNVNNTTATAWFDKDTSEDGNQPYELTDGEEVTVSFTAFHGWLTSGANQSVSLVNSDGVVLAGYTYNLGSCNLTGVTVAGNAASITPYNLQSKSASKNANGLDNGKSQGYVTTAGNNPVITFTVAKSGRCVVNIQKSAAGIDNSYPDNVANGVKMDIAKIVITCASNNGDRTICIDDLSVTSEISATPKADFAIKYVDETGTEIKSQSSGNDEVGSAPVLVASDKETFVVGENKYVYASDDASSKTIAGDGSTVVTVTFNTLHKYNYSVTNSLGAQIASGSVFTDETADATWNKYINVDGQWYETEAPYGVTLTSAAPTKVVEYTASDIAYFFEAENILSRSYGNPNGFYSGGTSAAVYTGATLTLPNIAAGTYTITVNSTVRRSNEDIFNVQVSTDGSEWTDAGQISLTSNVGGDYSIAHVTLPADGTIRLVEGKSQNFCHYVDYVVVYAEASATMTVNATAQYGTFCAPFAVEVPAGVTASTATLNANGATIDLTSVGTTIPANTPVILYAEDGLAATTFYGVAVAGTPEAGALLGVYEATPAPVGSYVLQLHEGVAGFYQVDAVVPTVGANRCYLTAPSAANVRAFFFDAETAIKSVETAADDAPMYNAAGVRVNNNYKGIVIKGGKKYLAK